MLKAICSGKELSSDGYYSCVEDIINAPELEPLKNITHHIYTTRFQHCLNVSYHCYTICRILRLDARSAARAGLLHDLFYYDRKEYNASREKGQPNHSKCHSETALRNARMLTDISPKEHDMIQKHMWPMTAKLPKYGETYIITIVDKYCALLEFCIPKFSRLVQEHKL